MSPPRNDGDGKNGAAEIASQLRQAILEGKYQHRDRLPPERDLAAEFGAARGTIRQALKQLKDMDLVQRKAGSGTYVNYVSQPDHQDVAESTSPLELIEVRLAVEPAIVRMAVGNASSKNLWQVHDALLALEKAGDNPAAFSEADEAFHLSLARCSQNSLFEWIYQIINDVRGHHQWDVKKDQLLKAQNIAEYNEQHWALYEAIRRRNAAEAVQIITDHLNKAKLEFTEI